MMKDKCPWCKKEKLYKYDYICGYCPFTEKPEYETMVKCKSCNFGIHLSEYKLKNKKGRNKCQKK